MAHTDYREGERGRDDQDRLLTTWGNQRVWIQSELRCAGVESVAWANPHYRGLPVPEQRPSENTSQEIGVCSFRRGRFLLLPADPPFRNDRTWRHVSMITIASSSIRGLL